MAELIDVYLAYAPRADEQYYERLSVPRGTSIIEALDQAGWLDQFDDLQAWCTRMANQAVSAKDWRVGVYAKKQPLDYQLHAFDRIEVYRPLRDDPMSRRKQKVKTKPAHKP